MKTKVDTQEFNFHISHHLQRQLAQLQNAGLSMSAIARLAIRKCSALTLDPDDEPACPKRVQLYLHAEDARLLEQLAAHEGDSRARTLRRLIATYLRLNATAIADLF